MSRSVTQNPGVIRKPKRFEYLRILLVPIVLTFALCGGMAWYILDLYGAIKTVNERDLKIIDLSNKITYYDEVLTSSARLAATTGSDRWEARYLDVVPLLDDALAKTEALVPQAFEGDAIAQTEAANHKLIAI